MSLNGYKLEDASRGLVIKYAEDQHKKKELTRLQGLTIAEYDSSPYSRSMNIATTVDVDNSIDHSLMNNDRNNQPTTFYYYPNQQHQQQQQIHSPINTNTSVAHQVHHLSNPQHIYNNNHNNNMNNNNMNSNMYANHQSVHPMLQHLPVGMQQTTHMNVPAMTATHYPSYQNHPVHHNMPIPQPQATHLSQHTTMLQPGSSNYNNNNMKGEYIPNHPSIYAINNWYNPTMSYTQQHIGDINMSNQPYVHNNSNITNSHSKYSPQQTTNHNNNINSNTKKGLTTTSSVSKKQQQYYNTSPSSYNSSHFTKNGKPNHNTNDYVKHNSADNNNNNVTLSSLLLVVSNLPLNIDVQGLLYKLFSAYGKIINSTNTSDSNVDDVKYSIEIIPYNLNALQLAVQNMNGSYCVCEGSSPIQIAIYT